MAKKKVITEQLKNKKIINHLSTGSKMVIYQAKSGAIEMRGDLGKETLWASLDQIAQVFGRDKSVISRHIRNIFKEQELDPKAVVAKNATTANDGKVYQVDYFNLDMILSVGYRVNSKTATAFRIWATKTLREYITKGIVLNEKRFKESHINTLRDIQKTVAFIQEVALRKQLDQDEMKSLLSVVRDYAHSWELLDQYDKGDVLIASSKKKTKLLDYENVRGALDTLKHELIKKGEAGDLFAKERDGSFQGILKTIHQTFDGKELYPSLEEKAAHLLYFVIKDHPFFDGNKRSGAFLFIWFLQINNALFKKNSERKINDNALVALALLIAQSDPRDKEQMVALTTQLIK
jgi:prophage maintenance system killer protein